MAKNGIIFLGKVILYSFCCYYVKKYIEVLGWLKLTKWQNIEIGKCQNGETKSKNKKWNSMKNSNNISDEIVKLKKN